MKNSVRRAPKGESVRRDLFEPPLNMMSFMILVKFLLVGEDQILFVSGKLILGNRFIKNINSMFSVYSHGVVFLPLEEEMKERLAQVKIPHGFRSKWPLELTPDKVALRVHV